MILSFPFLTEAKGERTHKEKGTAGIRCLHSCGSKFQVFPQLQFNVDFYLLGVQCQKVVQVQILDHT